MSFKDLLEKRKDDPRPYLHYYHRKLQHRLTFQEYAGKVRGLISLRPDVFKLPPGSSVMVLTGNTAETFIAYGALMAQGLTVVPVDPQEASPYVELVREHVEVRAVISAGDFLVADISDDPEIKFRGGPCRSFFFTSGTTGDPKAVTQNFTAILSNLEGTRRAGEITERDVLMSCLPVFHVNAFNFSFLLPIYLGNRIVYSNGFPLNFWKMIEEERVSVASLSPPIIRLLNEDKRAFTHKSGLRYVISASSALYKEDMLTFQERFGTRINQAYGLSETVNFTLFTPPDLAEEIHQGIMIKETVPSAGSPVWGNEVFVLDENGKVVEASGVIGEIAVRGWNVHEGYYRNPTATTESFRDGYFHTGDTGYFREFDGKRFFYLTGRIKEIVKRNGKLIYLSEVDAALKTLRLKEACAVGFPNSFTEEEVGLYMVSGVNDREPEEILRALRSILSFPKCPKVIVTGPGLPKTSVGKIKRKELRSLFFEFKEVHFYEK